MKKLFFYIYKTFFFDPLAGGNGKIQTSEMAQWVLVIMAISASIKEGRSGEQLYPDMYWICLFGCVAAIASVKVVFPKKEITNEPPPVI